MQGVAAGRSLVKAVGPGEGSTPYGPPSGNGPGGEAWAVKPHHQGTRCSFCEHGMGAG